MTYVLSITISFFQIMENRGTKKTLIIFLFLRVKMFITMLRKIYKHSC